MQINIIVGADIVPTKNNIPYFENEDIQTLIGKELEKKLKEADFTIFNLEVPLTDQNSPINKCGPNLIAPRSTVRGLKAMDICFLNLANNHILDQGEQGLYSTMEVLENAGINYAGAGRNLEEARKYFVKEIAGIKIGIYCCAEHEFSIATNKKGGANPFDCLESFDEVEKMKKNCDYAIVLYHGGKEHYRYPSPNLQRVCRKLVEKGSDLVVCQHSHCIGAEEGWKDGKIIYGQGNFLFDHNESEYWKTSILIDIKLEKKDKKLLTEIKYIPICKQKEYVRTATSAEGNRILSEFRERSIEIKNPEILEKKYNEFANLMFPIYANAFLGKKQRGLFYRLINKISNYNFGKWYAKQYYGKNEVLALRNYIECEAHRELLLKGIKTE